jgi:hypothetical protein
MPGGWLVTSGFGVRRADRRWTPALGYPAIELF